MLQKSSDWLGKKWIFDEDLHTARISHWPESISDNAAGQPAVLRTLQPVTCHLSAYLGKEKAQWKFLPPDFGIEELNQAIMQLPASQREV